LFAAKDAEIAQLKADKQKSLVDQQNIMQAIDSISQNLENLRLQLSQQHEQPLANAAPAGHINITNDVSLASAAQDIPFTNEMMYDQLGSDFLPYGTLPPNNAYPMGVQPMPQVAENLELTDDDSASDAEDLYEEYRRRATGY
jgi:hypothetical protein